MAINNLVLIVEEKAMRKSLECFSGQQRSAASSESSSLFSASFFPFPALLGRRRRQECEGCSVLLFALLAGV
ncbi:hypothetical protein CesoFtcFv8_008618 [Champsocephalus esox]|uniref:Uncharacterized protein n=1 Tax=Champsocephalus esox TaxID=159716 RepID=A0AAN8H0U5_9TELE|nr:hypothetical protein CesoFtcFv8_008618 [Champsocephalus esox]